MNNCHLWAALAALALATGCTTTKQETKRGELVLVVQTDLSVPKDVSSVRVEVLTSGRVQFAQSYLLGKAPLLEMPGALSIVAGDNPSDPVSIRILARQVSSGADPDQGVARVLREIITTVPPDRTAMLPVTLQWLCADDKSVQVSSGGEVSSACGEGETCVAGSCVTQEIDSSTLPDFVPQVLEASAPGSGCYDTLACLASAPVVAPDVATCTLPAPSGDSAQWNVALRFPPDSDGTCDATHCFVPLDFSDSDSGWNLDEQGALRLPASVCDSQPVPEVVVSTSCASKTTLTPVCGPASRFDTALPVGDPATPVDMMPPVDMPMAESTLLSGIPTPWNIVVEPQGVFFVAGAAGGLTEGVYQCALAGCNSKAQTLWEGPPGTRAAGFAHNQTRLVIWASTAQGMDLHACPFPSGCAATPSAVIASSVMAGQLNPRQNMLGLTDNTVYFREVDPSPAIKSCDMLDSGCGAASATLFSDRAGVTALALTTDSLVWTNQAGDLQSCVISDCAGTVKVLAAGQTFVTGPVLSGNTVVWASDRNVRACQLDNCTTTLRELFTSAQPVSGLAADASNAYFGFMRTADQHDLVKVPLDGGALGQTLRSGTGLIAGLGVDAGFVYSVIVDTSTFTGALLKTSTTMMAAPPMMPMP